MKPKPDLQNLQYGQHERNALDLRMAKSDKPTPLGLIVHHPKFGVALKERLDALGIECVVQYLDRPGGVIVRHGGQSEGAPVSEFDFVSKRFERAKRSSQKQSGHSESRSVAKQPNSLGAVSIPSGTLQTERSR